MMIGKIIKSLAKQLIVIGIVIAISIAIMSVNETAGIILMMLYSSWMVIKSSNKEMPLNKFTALLPGIMSIVIFLIMLALFNVENEIMPLIGIGLGLITGGLMARGHDVYMKNGMLYAKRTFFYVFIWALSILFTQGSTLLGMREITDFGLLLNGFSTAMMVILSMILFFKTFKKKTLINATTHGSYLVLVSIIIFSLPQTSNAGTIHCAPNNEICCFAHAFGTGGPVKFEICMAQGMSFEVDNIPSSSTDSFSFPNDETAAAGVILALLMLLASLGLNTSMLIAQGATTAAMSASQSSVDSIVSTDEKDSTSTEDKYGNDNILDGKNAISWMIEHGYFIKKDDQLVGTNKYEEFKNSLPSESGKELQGYAVDEVGDNEIDGIPLLDKDGNPIGGYAIIRDEGPAQQGTNQKDDDLTTDTNSSVNDTTTLKDDNLKTKESDTEISKDKTTTFSDDNKDITSDSSSSDTDNKSTTSSNGSELKPSKDEVPTIDYSNAREDFENLMGEKVKQQINEGYYVRNSHTLQNAFAAAQERNPEEWKWGTLYYPGLLMDKGWKVLNNLGEVGTWIHEDLTWHPLDYLIGWKGGQCGNYADLGKDWSEQDIKDLYGEDTYISKIVIHDNQYESKNHAATRVVLPNGEKYVLDYWEGIQEKRTAVYTEKEWIQKQEKDFGLQGIDSRINYPNESNDMNVLDGFVNQFGAEKGEKLFTKISGDTRRTQIIIEEWKKVNGKI